jgi:hypothetical protein
MNGVIPLWLALVAGSASVFATGYIAGQLPDTPSLGVLATSYVGAWTASTFVYYRQMGILNAAPEPRHAFGAFWIAFLVGIPWILFVAGAIEESNSSGVDEVPAEGGDAGGK